MSTPQTPALQRRTGHGHPGRGNPKNLTNAGKGRPKGARNKRTVHKQFLLSLNPTGELPHEFLARIVYADKLEFGTGKHKQTIYPTFEQRMQAANWAAPYFAPRLSSMEIIKGVSDDDLDAIIVGAAAEAKIGISISGTGTQVVIASSAGRNGQSPDAGAGGRGAIIEATDVQRPQLARRGSVVPVRRSTEAEPV